MEFFNKKINEIDFSFRRVFYGGNLWYHITFNENNKPITFRMNKDEHSIWKMQNQELPIELHKLIQDSEMKIVDAIIKNEVSN